MTKYKAMKVDGVKHDEHRYIVEQSLGRTLDRNEVVHHINGDPRDNRLDNLRVMSIADHTRLHNVGRIDPEWLIEKRSSKMIGNLYGTPRKLTDEEVRYVRKNYKPRDKEFGARALGKKYGISHSEISRIARNIAYRSVE